jgi:PTS system galactitol-specific IIB component
MNRAAVILVMCGSSIATSTLAAVKIENEAKKRGVSVSVKKGKVSDANVLIKSTKADLIVATAVLADRDDIPVFNGVPLLTGVGQKELYDEIFGVIAKLKD